MSSLDTLLSTSTIAGNGNWDTSFPDLEKKVVLDPNTIIVREGTEVKYTVEKDGYLPVSGELIAKNFVHDIYVTMKKYVTLTLQVSFTPIEEDTDLPNILLSSDIYYSISETKYSADTSPTLVKAERTISVPEGSYVSYTIEKSGFNTKRGNVKVIYNTNYPISLNGNSWTFTVEPTPSSASVEIVAEKPLSPQEGNSIVVVGKPNSGESLTSTITYTVSLQGYETYINTLPYIEENTTVRPEIKKFFKFDILVEYPEDATAKITDIVGAKPWYPQHFYDLNSLVRQNNKFYNAIRQHTSSAEFDESNWVEVVDSAWVLDGDTVKYEVKRVGYKDVKSNIVVKKDEHIVVRMESTGSFCIENTQCIPDQEKIISPDPTQNVFVLESNSAVSFQSEGTTDINVNRYSFDVVTEPNTATVEITYNGITYDSKHIDNILEGDYISYVVHKEHYISQEDSICVMSNVVKEHNLELESHSLSINPIPNDATVTLIAEGYTQEGNSIVVPYGTTVQYYASRKFYEESEPVTKVVYYDDTINLPLTREKYTLTLNVVPAEDTILELSADRYETVTGLNGTASITVDSETIINYTASHEGYVTKEGSLQLLESGSLNISMTPTYTYTINTTPADATVTLIAEGYTQFGNSIIVPSGTEVTYRIQRTDMKTIEGTKEVDENITDTITMSYVPGKVLFESNKVGKYEKYFEVPGNYEIILVGGGGKRHSNYWWYASGGGGAYAQGIKYMHEGTYELTIGGLSKYSPTSISDKEYFTEAVGRGGDGNAVGSIKPGTGGTIANTTLSTALPGNNGNGENNYYAAKDHYPEGGLPRYKTYGKGEGWGYNKADSPGTVGYIKITAVEGE